MKINLKITGKLFKAAFKGWWAKDPFKESAVIAYYAIFSIPGLLVIIIAIVGCTSMIVFYGAEFTHAYAVRQDGFIPPDKNAVKQQGRNA